MADNYPLTREEIGIAYRTSIIHLAEQYGFRLQKERNAYKIIGENFGGLYLFENGGYYRHSSDEKGNNVDFLMRYCGVSSKIEAYKILLEQANITPSAVRSSATTPPAEPKGEMILPAKWKGKCSNVFYYLSTVRCIDFDVIVDCVKKGILYQDIHRNAVFVGKDNEGKARYASLRGTYDVPGKAPFKGEAYNSDKSYSFNIPGQSNTVYVFEGAIDVLSHVTFFKRAGLDISADHRIACGSTSDLCLQRYIKEHPNITNIVFCLDNDHQHKNSKGELENVGQIRACKLMREYKAKGYNCKRIIPQFPYKDFNEQLVACVTQERQIAKYREQQQSQNTDISNESPTMGL